MLKTIAHAIATAYPEVHLMLVLVGERPEEVTDLRRTVRGEVIASTFDQSPGDHIKAAELAIERAKRLAELGRDVVVMLDSLTRLGRAYNLAAPASSRTLTGGVAVSALQPPRQFLGAARCLEEGGSLTILSTALIDTGSLLDNVLFEEFKGTGNMELRLRRDLAEKRLFPAIDPVPSGTRREDLLMDPAEHAAVVSLRRALAALDSQHALELLLDKTTAPERAVPPPGQRREVTAGNAAELAVNILNTAPAWTDEHKYRYLCITARRTGKVVSGSADQARSVW